MSLISFLRGSSVYTRNLKPLYSTFTRDNVARQFTAAFHSRRAAQSGGILKFTVVSASIGALLGVGYSGYTHYQINVNREFILKNMDEPVILKHKPDVIPTRKIVSPTDAHNLQLVLFQYQTCPFCCKVRAFLDSQGLSYDVVEVDAVLRQSIKWSKYKKVPILVAKTETGYQQLNDSSTIISVLSSYLLDTSQDIGEVLKYYPTVSFIDDNGKGRDEILNKYFLMFKEIPKSKTSGELYEERKWRKWCDEVLVHTLSPNVYRTMDEAHQAFNWFAEVGEWRENFPAWECSLMVNVGASVMWLIGKRLKKRHQLKDDVRQSLYDECNLWLKAIREKNSTFMGGSSPDLSDLAVYGVLSSIEGCDAFKDLMNNTKMNSWYDEVKNHISAKKGAVVTV